MRTPGVELIADVRNGTGESPLWDPAARALWWVDIPAGVLYRHDWDSGALRSWKAPEMVGCIALAGGDVSTVGGGGFVAGMESGIFHLVPGEDGTLAARRLAGVDHPGPGMRFNDGRCDRQGRFWAGTMHMDVAANNCAGALYRYDDRGLHRQGAGYMVANGMAFSPDGRVMYLSDSHPQVQSVWTFDYDVEDGMASNRRLWLDMRAYPGRPDGAAVDVDGCYWICGNDAGLVHRFTPQGKLDRSVALPVKKPAMCAFGGPDLNTLFVTSIRPGDAALLADQPLAGGVFAFRPGVQGIAESRFKVDLR